MKLLFTRIQPRRRSHSHTQALLDEYLARIRRYRPVDVRDFTTQEAFEQYLAELAQRSRPQLVLTDSQGQPLTSDAFALELGKRIDSGIQLAVFAIGPPDGWSPALLKRASLVLSFGRITLPHELAAVILAEQTYRALTILSGHPYHTGHENPR